MPALSKTFDVSKHCKENCKLTMPLFLLLAICLFGRLAEAEYGGGSEVIASAQTSTYVFLSEQSKVVKVGGFAGVHETYPIEGQFQLSVDFDAGTAWFGQVDAKLIDESGLLYERSLDVIFNMAELLGTVADDTTIDFVGKTADGMESSILLTLTFRGDSVHLAGRTVPPPNSADFFIYELDAVAQRKYGGGTGEPNDPYKIATAEDLMLLGKSPEDYDKHFILTADIDLDPNLPGRKVFDGAVIAPDTNDVESGFQGISFTGVFDGNGHTISHLTIKGKSYLGLFGKLVSGAIISNLGMEAVDVNGTGIFVGGLVGWNEYGSIAVSYSAGTVSGNGSVGGLAGWNEHGNIAASYSTGTVTGFEYVGGLVGWNEYGSIIASYSTGKAAGAPRVGGLVGCNGGIIAASYSTGRVTGFEYVGGLAGGNGGSITTSYSTGVVSGDYRVGGLVGLYDGTVTSSFWDVETSEQTTGDGGTGLTTTEMQDINTYLNAGWDFVEETLNGTCDYWQISPGDYPRLHYHIDESPVMPEGLGTAQQPYIIRDAWDLGTVWFKPVAHYRLEAPVDLSGITWSIAAIPWFGGTFDGNGHTISHLTIRGGGYLGLFCRLSEGANVSNLGLEAVDINGTGDYIGGLVGLNDKGNIITSYSTGTISGQEILGGLVGWNRYGSIIDSYSTAKVTGTWEVGGLVGWVFEGSVTASYSTGMVSGDYDVGGLVGWNGFGSVTASYSTATTIGAEWDAGGLVGWNSDGSIIASYSTGAVTGGLSVGGLVGGNGGSIATSYSTGVVDGNDTVGGLVGYNDNGSISDCYSIGPVDGNDTVGGLVGGSRHVPIDPITASFWDMETSGLVRSAGGIGLTTAEMQNAGTFLDAGWDFVDESVNGTEDIWSICEGTNYPRLVRQIPAGDFVCPDGITIDDFLFFIEHWQDDNCDQSNDYCQGTDLDFSGTVDINDLEIFLENWLADVRSD